MREGEGREEGACFWRQPQQDFLVVWVGGQWVWSKDFRLHRRGAIFLGGESSCLSRGALGWPYGVLESRGDERAGSIVGPLVRGDVGEQQRWKLV